MDAIYRVAGWECSDLTPVGDSLMAGLHYIDDTYWPEVENINGFAVFIGYLMMGVRGLGVLVVTWTTVVLLGGFVTDLHEEDFSSLTVITLIQIAGVVDFLFKEKSRDIVSSWRGLAAAAYAVFRPRTWTGLHSTGESPSSACRVLALVLWVVQQLVLGIVLCPLAAIYLLGLLFSTGGSLWRLKKLKLDYGNAHGGPNLKPALTILYSLTVAQGVMFAYMLMHRLFARRGLAEKVASDYSLPQHLVSDYLDETVAGCMKDPTFASGRNLITYAVDLLVSESRDSHIPGVQILGTVIKQGLSVMFIGQAVLINRLLTGSPSFSYVIQRLLETLGPRSPYNSEIREHAARIVAHVAGSIRLEQFPAPGGMIRCVFSLLHHTDQEYSCWQPAAEYKPPHYVPMEYDRDWLLEKYEQRYLKDYRGRRRRAPTSESMKIENRTGLETQGLRILEKLVVHSDNVRVMVQSSGDALPYLTRAILNAENNAEYRILAARILELLRLHYTEDVYLMKLKQDVMPKVPHIVAGQEIEEITEASASSSHEQNHEQQDGRKQLEAMASLCATVGNTWVQADDDLASRYNHITSDIRAAAA